MENLLWNGCCRKAKPALCRHWSQERRIHWILLILGVSLASASYVLLSVSILRARRRFALPPALRREGRVRVRASSVRTLSPLAAVVFTAPCPPSARLGGKVRRGATLRRLIWSKIRDSTSCSI